MATYRYTARDARDARLAGVIEAASLDEALDLLISRGLLDVQVTQVPDGEASERIDPSAEEVRVKAAHPPVNLSSREAGEVTQNVAQVSVAKLPLAAGLRAAADETSSRRVALALRWIAEQIDDGRSLEEILTQSGRLLPRHVSGLILAAAETGTLGGALCELVEHQQTTRDLRRGVVDGFMYPAAVVVLAFCVVFFTGYYVTSLMADMVIEFGLKLPAATQLLLWWRDTGIWILGAAFLLFACGAVCFRIVAGRANWWRLVGTIPLFGPLWHWSGVAEWSGLLSVLLKHNVALPDALRLAGHGTRDANVGRLSLRLADGVSRGRSLTQMMFVNRELPATLIPLIEWGEAAGGLAESFRIGYQMFAKRVRMRAQLLQAVIPPVLFIGIGCLILFVASAGFIPMVDLISKLS